MAWKVYGFMEGHTTGRTTVYGPLPRKRWINEPGDKKRRVSGRSNPFKQAFWDRDEQARKAIEYALWLAKRDGVELPGGHPIVVWAGVTLPTGKYQPRVSCVTFGNSLPRVRIDIPNWDWIPAEPVMQINDDYFRDLLACEIAA
jgi:hypothetical protein